MPIHRLRVTPGTSGPFVGVSVARSGNLEETESLNGVKITLPPVWVAISQAVEGVNQSGTAGRGICSLLEHFSCPGTTGPLYPRPPDSGLNHTPALPGLQLADSRWWNLWASTVL